jgi:hypothetical protein
LFRMFWPQFVTSPPNRHMKSYEDPKNNSIPTHRITTSLTTNPPEHQAMQPTQQ